jgi:hypothetical protein
VRVCVCQTAQWQAKLNEAKQKIDAIRKEVCVCVCVCVVCVCVRVCVCACMMVVALAWRKR